MDSIFLVIGEAGDCDTYGTWVVRAFKHEDVANAFAFKLNHIVKEFLKDKKGKRLHTSAECYQLVKLLVEAGDPNARTALFNTPSYDWDEEIPFEE